MSMPVVEGGDFIVLVAVGELAWAAIGQTIRGSRDAFRRESADVWVTLRAFRNLVPASVVMALGLCLINRSLYADWVGCIATCSAATLVVLAAVAAIGIKYQRTVALILDRIWFAAAVAIGTGVLAWAVLFRPVRLGFDTACALLALTYAAGRLVVAGRRLRKQIDAQRAAQSAAMLEDARQPVLYLRQFAYEGQPFVAPVDSDLGPTALPVLRADLSGFETLEDFLAPAIERSLGPFIALGNPQDLLPPLGASRQYLTDRHWKERFGRLAREARAIVLDPGSSGELSWELAFVLREGIAPRMFVIVGPLTFLDQSGESVDRQFRLRMRRPKWPDFRRVMLQAGYDLSSGTLPGSAVIVFDRTGKGKVMGCHFTPEAYVDTMLSHLERVEPAT